MPTLIDTGLPLTLRSLTTVTVSPSCKMLPAVSLITESSSLAAPGESWSAEMAAHSCPHSGHANNSPNSYVYTHAHFGHGGSSLIRQHYDKCDCPRSSVDRASVSGTAGRMFDSCRGHWVMPRALGHALLAKCRFNKCSDFLAVGTRPNSFAHRLHHCTHGFATGGTSGCSIGNFLGNDLCNIVI